MNGRRYASAILLYFKFFVVIFRKIRTPETGYHHGMRHAKIREPACQFQRWHCQELAFSLHRDNYVHSVDVLVIMWQRKQPV